MITKDEFLKILATQPTVRIPEFKSKLYGGKSPCIPINESNGFTLPNCTGLAWGEWLLCAKVDSSQLDLCGGNAISYYGHKDKYERGQKPKIGAIACWEDNKYGHVGIVEHIYPSGAIDVKMSSYGGSICYTRHLDAPYSYTNDLGDKMTFQGFIYCPYIEEKVLKPIDEVAHEVIEGKWGNGQTRYKRLTEAGYSYNEVQNRVNEILAEQRELKVGDSVKIINKGNSQANGKGHNAYGYGWTRKILRIHSGAEYPYQVGTDNGTTGFYKKDALKKL